MQGFTPYRRCLGGLGPFWPRPRPRPKTIPRLLAATPSWTSSAAIFAKLDLSTDWNSLKEAEPELLINSLSMLCPFTPRGQAGPPGGARPSPPGAKRMVTLIEFALHSGADEEILQ